MAMGHQALILAQGELGTGGVQDWIQSNAIPLIMFVVAALLLFLGGAQGDNRAVMRRIGGVIAGLALVGFAVSGAGVDIASWLSGLFTG